MFPPPPTDPGSLRYGEPPEAPLADHHNAFWDWVWEDRGELGRPPFCGFWPRGGAKSTNVERGAAALGGLGNRHYILYVCGTQEQADDHVASISSILQSDTIKKYYPNLGTPALNKFGERLGWRRNRLQTANNFTIDALGMNTFNTRGIKIDIYRPDVIIIDDIDSDLDSPDMIDKKVRLLQKKILPAGASNLMVIFIQNIIHGNSIAARLAKVDGADPIDMLHNRIVSGPFPALLDFEYRERKNGGFDIISGTPTWAGQDLRICQSYIDNFGISAFITECQNEVDVPQGGVFEGVTYRSCEWEEVHRVGLLRGAVWVDPAVTSTDKSDNQGIQADGFGINKKIYRLYSWEGVQSPQLAIKRAIKKAVDLGKEFGCAFSVGIETDQGGDTWLSVYREAIRELQEEEQIGPFDAPKLKTEKAGSGFGPKMHRGQQQRAMYDRGVFFHAVGTSEVIRRAQRRFGKMKPFDLVDAGYWSAMDLLGRIGKRGAVGKSKRPGQATNAYQQAVAKGYRPEG